MQEVKLAAVQIWQSIIREDAKCVLMFVGHRLMFVIKCEGFLTNFYYSYGYVPVQSNVP